MKNLHINVESEDDWLIAQGLEEPGLTTQARSFDELLANIREVVELLEIDDKDLHVELIVSPSAQRIARTPARKRQKSTPPGKFRSNAALRR